MRNLLLQAAITAAYHHKCVSGIRSIFARLMRMHYKRGLSQILEVIFKGMGSVGIEELFSQALLHRQSGQLHLVEEVLQAILTKGPLNINSLNFLKDLALIRDTKHILFDLANLLGSHGRLEEAAISYSKLLQLTPLFAEAHNNFGTVLNNLGRLEECERAYKEALDIRPRFPEAKSNLGNLFAAQGRFEEAEECFLAAIDMNPLLAEAHNNLGNLLRIRGRLDESKHRCREALRLKPDYPSALANMGNTLREAGEFNEARDHYEAALKIDPNFPEALNNLGSLLFDLGTPEAAISKFRAASIQRPNYIDAHVNLALALFLYGRFAEGWLEYEWRWQQPRNKTMFNDVVRPRWEGEETGDRVLLLRAEQGFGDTLQFCRFVPSIAVGRRVILEVQPSLVPLLAGLPGIEQIVAQGDPLPPFDLYCPLLSLPRILGVTLENIPAEVPYLQADPNRVAMWRQRLEGLKGLKVGLVWAGNEAMGADRRRSIALARFSRLAEVEGVSFISLQKGAAAEQAPPPGMVLHDWTSELIDFGETAALIEALDLVIGVDTAVIHLAGALGRPVWLLNRFDRCWRWLLDRDDSPWYPTLRQFRQLEPGDWETVLDQVRQALQSIAGKRISGSDISLSFQQALALHQSGHFPQAETAYLGILRVVPDHADSTHLLGVIALQSNNYAVALDYISKALKLKPDTAVYHNNIGSVLKALSRHSEAEYHFREAIRLNSEYPDPRNNLGNLLFNLGRLGEAQETYNAALLLSPDNIGIRVNVGNALFILGDFKGAELHFRKVLLHEPNNLAALINLGCVLKDTSRLHEAEACYRAALSCEPEQSVVHLNLGNVLSALERHDEAETHLHEAIRLKPNSHEAHAALGNHLFRYDRFEAAEICFREALRFNARYAVAHIGLGNVLVDRDSLEKAEASYRTALLIVPEDHHAYNGLATLLIKQKSLEAAEKYCWEALRRKPDFVDTLSNLGVVYEHSGRLSEAEEMYRKVIDIQPNHIEAHINLGNLASGFGNFKDAEPYYREALRHKLNHPDAHVNLALTLLLSGQFAEGWREYEWRWQQPRNKTMFSDVVQPRWEGEETGDRVLLLRAEQGFGDTLQFCRFVPQVAVGRRVILEVQPSLVPLLAGLPGIEQIVAQGDPLPPFDLYCPLLSLPRILGVTLENIPAEVPYLQADPNRVAMWRQRLEGLKGLKVGLVWAGNEAMGADRRRSIALARFSRLAEVEGVSFISLQKGAAAEQAPPPGMVLHDWTSELIDFGETAALIEALDLVIGVDTAVIHLAGALGRPVWLLNRFDRCWRWLLDRDDSPWYPTLRQFRQLEPGDWETVLDQVRQALCERVMRELLFINQ